MKKNLTTNLLVALLGLMVQATMGAYASEPRAAAWKPAPSPLMTRWAKDVSPDRALPEYPRPQMARKDWQNLNGLWDYAITGATSDPPANFEGKILVPFCVESALSGVGRRVDAQQALFYHRTFTLPPAWKGRRILLHFGAADFHATVAVNGKTVGEHSGGYDGFDFDITDALHVSGTQEITVRVDDATGDGQARGKQSLKPEGIFYTPTTGIWQTVWLEPVPTAHIADLKMTPDVDGGALVLRVTTEGAQAGDTVEAVATEAGQAAGRSVGMSDTEMRIAIPHARLWSPDHPTLYGLRVTLKRAGRVVDSVESYFGMRKIALGKDANGVTRPMLNGKFVFQVGPLDQGFWPDGIYTAPTDAALRSDIETIKRLGFNMARKHVKVEPDRWYYWCDKLGLLVWQDMPAAFETADNAKPPARPEWRAQFEHELQRLVEGRFNHPSIIMWVVFNEGWGQYDTQRLVKWVAEMDSSRLVDDASGWTDKGVGSVIDMHNYPGPGSPKPEANRAAVLGEFGGLGLGVDGHTWAKKTWGYRQFEDSEKLTRSYIALLRKAWALKDSAGLSAAVYTQITDVETECNGLLTYDRALVKMDAARVAAANRGQLPPEPVTKPLVPSAQQEAVTWRWTTQRPAEGWFRPDFDDSAWKQGQAGFGTTGTPGAIVRTTWNTDDIWIRRNFTLSQVPSRPIRLWMHHDEDAEVYINGVLAAQVSGYITDYEAFDLTPAGRKALKSGVNTLAVHCHQTVGGQYIDVGLIRDE